MRIFSSAMDCTTVWQTIDEGSTGGLPPLRLAACLASTANYNSRLVPSC
jgi:hypothetical protein